MILKPTFWISAPRHFSTLRWDSSWHTTVLQSRTEVDIFIISFYLFVRCQYDCFIQYLRSKPFTSNGFQPDRIRFSALSLLQGKVDVPRDVRISKLENKTFRKDWSQQKSICKSQIKHYSWNVHVSRAFKARRWIRPTCQTWYSKPFYILPHIRWKLSF